MLHPNVYYKNATTHFTVLWESKIVHSADRVQISPTTLPKLFNKLRSKLLCLRTQKFHVSCVLNRNSQACPYKDLCLSLTATWIPRASILEWPAVVLPQLILNLNLIGSRVTSETNLWACPWGMSLIGLTQVRRSTLNVSWVPVLHKRREQTNTHLSLLPNWTHVTNMPQATVMASAAQ